MAAFIGETNILTLTFSGKAAGEWTIKELASVFLPRDGGHMPNSDCSLSIRPEMIARISDADKSKDSAESVQFEAVVDGHVFLGDVIRYSAQLPSGNSIRSPRISNGRSVYLDRGREGLPYVFG